MTFLTQVSRDFCQPPHGVIMLVLWAVKQSRFICNRQQTCVLNPSIFRFAFNENHLNSNGVGDFSLLKRKL